MKQYCEGYYICYAPEETQSAILAIKLKFEENKRLTIVLGFDVISDDCRRVYNASSLERFMNQFGFYPFMYEEEEVYDEE